MEAPVSPPPAKRARRFVSPRGKQSGGFAWLAVFEILYYVIVIDHFLAYMNIRRGYKIYTRVGDFDPPTHQPTNMYILVPYMYISGNSKAPRVGTLPMFCIEKPFVLVLHKEILELGGTCKTESL